MENNKICCKIREKVVYYGVVWYGRGQLLPAACVLCARHKEGI